MSKVATPKTDNRDPFPRLVEFYPPHQELDGWTIRHIELTPETVERERIRAAFSGWRQQFAVYDLEPGTYVGLSQGGIGPKAMVMSDTPMERRTNLPVYLGARGHTILLGLGLGMVPMALFKRRPYVESLTILEYSPQVRAMVEPVVRKAWEDAGRPFPLHIIQGDAYNPRQVPGLEGRKFDFVWADIWGMFNADMWVEIAALKRIWRPFRKPTGEHMSWLSDIVRLMAEEDGVSADHEAVSAVIARYQGKEVR